jgi:arylformamidase
VNSQLEYYDISPEISSDTAVFPGDRAFSRKVSMDFGKGHNLVLSEIHSTVHIGAHVDAPIHYHSKGVAIHQRPLDYYLGSCQVISLKLSRGERIQPKHLKNVAVTARRVLFKTGSFPDPKSWNGDFNSLSPELVNYLAEKNVVLIGIDTPSIDPAEDKALESHQAIFKNDLAILEGIVLDEVPEGHYTLIALPLKLKDADASPVRAVLLKDQLFKKGSHE